MATSPEPAFTFSSFVLRVAGSLAIVLLTFNPSGWSYVHWFKNTFPKVAPLQAVAGLVLLIAWIFVVNATLRAIGKLGVMLGALLFAAIVWLFISWGWVELSGRGSIIWLVLIMLGFLMGIGLSWSHLRRRVAGQAVVDEIDDH
jgi:hypothetical protein